MIVDLPEHRESRTARIERTDGLILDCAALPLPDGATLMTSLDVTAGVNVERALTERNQALVAAEKLRNDFVNHVSYELRTPLTNIIGFTQLLAAGGVGPLNPKQLEYAGFITNSSHALLAIIDDILDLASIDAGALELRLEDVDVAEAMKAAAAGVQDRLSEAAIELRIVMTDGVGSLRADGRRVRQVLFNLLSNAINYSEAGQTVTLAAMRRGAEIVFKVSDRGRGIPPGDDRSRLRSVRDLSQRLASSRPRPRPVDRESDGRIASRPGADRYRAPGGHDGHLHFSRRSDGGAGGKPATGGALRAAIGAVEGHDRSRRPDRGSRVFGAWRRRTRRRRWRSPRRRRPGSSPATSSA